jgi:hypothetical protein
LKKNNEFVWVEDLGLGIWGKAKIRLGLLGRLGGEL